MVNGLIVVILYIIISLVSLCIVRYQYLRFCRHNNQESNIKTENKISYLAIIFISFLFTILNVVSTRLSSVYGSDRSNYAYEFTGARSVNSIGLEFIFKVVKSFHGNIETVFYLTTFICMFLTLVAYKKSLKADYKVFMLLLTSESVIYTFTALKQCYACAFACLFFIFAIEDRTKKGAILSFICAGLAFIFHTSGAILFPIMIILRIKKLSAKKRMLLIALSITSIVFLQPILIVFNKVIGPIFPILSYKIELYMVQGNDNEGVSAIAFIKYLPVYYIALLGIVKRKYYSILIENYNRYLIVAIIGAGLVAYSVVSYWFSRFTGIFYLPIFIFYNLINSKSKIKSNGLINNIIVYGAGSVVLIRKILLIFINYGAF